MYLFIYVRPTCMVVVITHCPTGFGLVWPRLSSHTTIPMFPVEFHLSTMFPLGSCTWQKDVTQTSHRHTKQKIHFTPLALFFDTDVRDLPVERGPLCLCTDGYRTAQTQLWLWRCRLVGSAICPFEWRWRRSWGWSWGWWCWWKRGRSLCRNSLLGSRGNLQLQFQESGTKVKRYEVEKRGLLRCK